MQSMSSFCDTFTVIRNFAKAKRQNYQHSLAGENIHALLKPKLDDFTHIRKTL